MSALLHSGTAVDFNPEPTYRLGRMLIINSCERTKNGRTIPGACGFVVTSKSARDAVQICLGGPDPALASIKPVRAS